MQQFAGLLTGTFPSGLKSTSGKRCVINQTAKAVLNVKDVESQDVYCYGAGILGKNENINSIVS